MYNSKEIKNKISLLREEMKKRDLDAFLITHADEYLLESTHKSNQRLKWIIGFSGSKTVSQVKISRCIIVPQVK